MKHLFYTFLAIFFSVNAYSQLTFPQSSNTHATPVFYSGVKAPGDSCGVYYNNYPGLEKTSLLYFEAMRTTTFEARAQLYHAPQPIEVSGLSFYSFETNPALDSLMAIVHLYDHEPINDTMGTLLAVDTVWVKHQAFSAVLPDIQVNAVFDPPVTVTEDYIVAVYTEDDDSLKIVTNDFFGGDGAAEKVSYIYYSDPGFPAFHGWYNAYDAYGAGYDGDYLINPRVKYDLHDDFTITDDTICPNVVSAGCVSYSQMPVYSDPHYNANSSTPSSHLLWLWGDGFQNTNLLTACHTYTASGDYTISLSDTLRRHDAFNPTCIGEMSNPIHVIADVTPNFTYVQGGTIINFTNTSTLADSVWWDFGDTTAGSSQMNPTHDYGVIDTFDVWLHAFNECSEDSVMIQIITDDVGIENFEFDFKMYPNPANQLLTVEGLAEGTIVELINILGQPIRRYQADESTLIIGTEEFTNGSYFIRVTTDSGQVTKKLLIKH